MMVNFFKFVLQTLLIKTEIRAIIWKEIIKNIIKMEFIKIW